MQTAERSKIPAFQEIVFAGSRFALKGGGEE
jgi:hypothetical protein